MKRYLESLQELPLSRLLWIGIPLFLSGGLLMFSGYRLMTQAGSTPTATGTTEQQPVLSTKQADTPTAPSNDIIRLAWFYKPPENGQLDLVAQNYDFFILTYKDEKERDRLKATGNASI